MVFPNLIVFRLYVNILNGYFTMGRKRGQPQLYSEGKSEHIFVDITPTGKRELDQKIYKLDAKLSRSEFLERLARGENIDIVEFNHIFFGVTVLIES